MPESDDLDRARRAVAAVGISAEALADLLRETYGEGYVVGTHAAMAALPAGVEAVGPTWEASIDWDNWAPGNAGAAAELAGADGGRGLAALLDDADVVIRGISDFTLDVLARELAAGVEAGESTAQLTARLNTALRDPVRAEVIARTESARAQTVATLDTYRENGMGGRRWLAASDAEADCAGLNGTTVAMDDEFPDGDPPLHPNCFPAGTLVSAAEVVASTERWYEGELVEVTTASGNHLAGTPNHPVLTPKGWVALGSLVEDDDLVGRPWLQREAAGHPNDDEVPSRIEDVARSLAGTGGVASGAVPVAAEDFHGDGEGSEVCVVRTDRLLRHGIDLPFGQPSEHLPLGIGDVGHGSLPAECDLAPMLVGVGSATNGSMSGGDVAPVLLRRPASDREPIGVGLTTDRHAGLSQPTTNGGTADACLQGDGVLALTGYVSSDDVDLAALPLGHPLSVQPRIGQQPANHLVGDAVVTGDAGHGLSPAVVVDRIIAIGRRPFAGHVYNLQTASGWYVAAGVIVHNCRCAIVPILASEMP